MIIELCGEGYTDSAGVGGIDGREDCAELSPACPYI